MTRNRTLRAFAATAATVLTLASLAGCTAPGDAENVLPHQASEAPSPRVAPAPTPERSPAPGIVDARDDTPVSEPPQAARTGLRIPSCDDLIPPDRVASISGHADFVNATELVDPAEFTTLLPPITLDAYTNALQQRFCAWGVPQSDVSDVVFIAELSISARNALLTALDGSEFVRGEFDGVTTFQGIHRDGVHESFWWLAFPGTAMIIGHSKDPEHRTASAVAAAMIAANSVKK